MIKRDNRGGASSNALAACLRELQCLSALGAPRRPAAAARFYEVTGRFPIDQEVGRHHMRELLSADHSETMFGVGCQHHSFKHWARYFDKIADEYRATKHEREVARQLINLARIRAGLKPMRTRKA